MPPNANTVEDEVQSQDFFPAVDATGDRFRGFCVTAIVEHNRRWCTDWETLVASTGDRPLGLEAAQLLAVVQWLRANDPGRPIEIETEGVRSAVIADIAAALEPASIHKIQSTHSLKSLSYLLDAPVPFRKAPDLFCLDLYKDFDINSITALAAPTVMQQDGVPDPP